MPPAMRAPGPFPSSGQGRGLEAPGAAPAERVIPSGHPADGHHVFNLGGDAEPANEVRHGGTPARLVNCPDW